MKGSKASTGSSLTDGLIVTMFMDAGPENLYNSSPLDESEAMAMSIKHLAAVATQTPGPGEILSVGPLPTPKRPYDTLAFIFFLKATDSKDVRLAHFGRVCVFWVITRSSATAKYANLLKQMIHRLMQSYHITSDLDLQKKDILEKIDKKLAIVEVGIDSYYISERKTFEPFVDMTLTPPKAPIVLIDNKKLQIRVLLRGKTSASEKTKLRTIARDYRQKLPKGSAYKLEFVSDPLESEVLLSKLGFMTQKSVGRQFEAFFLGKATFGEFDEFISSHLTPKRHHLVNQVLKSMDSEASLDLQELAKETDISIELIELILKNAINKGFISNGRIENRVLLFSTGS